MSNQTEKIIFLELTEAEATSALQLFDAALKGTGLQFAENAVHLTGKIQKAFAQLTTPTPLPTI